MDARSVTRPSPPARTSLLGLPRVYWVLWVGQFINRLGGFVLTFLPLYLTERHHYAQADAGRTLALYGAGNLAGASLGGWSSDHYGRRRTIVGFVAFSAVVLAGFAFAPPGPLIALAAVLHGVSNGYGPALSAAVADVVNPDDRKRAFGYLYWAVNLGFTFAATVGGALSRRGFHWLFFGDALTALVLAVMVFAYVPETRPAHLSERPSFIDSFRPFVDPRFTGFAVAQILVLSVFLQTFVMMPLQERAAHVSLDDIGRVAALNGVVIVLAQPVLGRFTRGVSAGALLAAAAVMVSVGALLGARARTTWDFVLTMTVVSLGEVAFASGAPTFVTEVAPPALRGSYQGAWSLCWAVATMAAPFVGPWALQVHGASATWTVAAMLSAVGAVLHATLTRRATAVR